MLTAITSIKFSFLLSIIKRNNTLLLPRLKRENFFTNGKLFLNKKFCLTNFIFYLTKSV